MPLEICNGTFTRINRSVASLGHQGVEEFSDRDPIFKTISNTFFHVGPKILQGGEATRSSLSL